MATTEREIPYSATTDGAERDGQRLALQARLGSLVVVFAMLLMLMPVAEIGFYGVLLIALAISGIGQANKVGGGSAGRRAGWVFVDYTIITIALIAPNPLSTLPPEALFAMQSNNFVYYFMLFAAMALTYSPRLMVLAGVMAAAMWAASTTFLASQYGFEFVLPRTMAAGFTAPGEMVFHLAPLIEECVTIVVVAGILAIVMDRSRRLVADRIAAAQETARFARYLPGVVIDRLQRKTAKDGVVDTHPAAVMFADIAGFTEMAETMSPSDMLATLRRFHAIVGAGVAEHGAAIDKFLGDGAMATFGIGVPGPHDAVDALACSRKVLDDVDDWNIERVAMDLPPVSVSIGVHHGEVVLGEIGAGDRLEFAVLGDAVNVASRLEEHTRDLDARIAVSAALIEAVLEETGEDEARWLLDGFVPRLPFNLRGRREPVEVWTFGNRSDVLPA